MNVNWKHIGTVTDNEPFLIKGLNIWNFEWKSTGQRFHLKDPLYNSLHIIDVYEIKLDAISIRFAASEFSNGVWGIYEEI